jgi:hypothetical protein
MISICCFVGDVPLLGKIQEVRIVSGIFQMPVSAGRVESPCRRYNDRGLTFRASPGPARARLGHSDRLSAMLAMEVDHEDTAKTPMPEI